MILHTLDRRSQELRRRICGSDEAKQNPRFVDASLDRLRNTAKLRSLFALERYTPLCVMQGQVYRVGAGTHEVPARGIFGNLLVTDCGPGTSRVQIFDDRSLDGALLKIDGRCLDVHPTFLYVYLNADCHGQANQRFEVRKSADNGAYTFISKMGSGAGNAAESTRCLDMTYSEPAGSHPRRFTVNARPCTSAANQLWYFD